MDVDTTRDTDSSPTNTWIPREPSSGAVTSTQTSTSDALAGVLESVGLTVVEQVVRGRREARHAPVPTGLTQAAADLATLCAPDGLFTHQADALSHIVAGRSVVVSTPTASGKSLTFMAAAQHVLTSAPGSRVLALYPTKSLIRDQLTRWRAAFEPSGRRVVELHGGVPTSGRVELLSSADVVLATPDVVHSWLLRTHETSDFLSGIRLLILDEAHAYDKVFGSQMAFLMRRLRASSSIAQLVATTATLAAPRDFVRDLTGMDVESVGPERDGSPSAGIRSARACVPPDGGASPGRPMRSSRPQMNGRSRARWEG